MGFMGFSQDLILFSGAQSLQAGVMGRVLVAALLTGCLTSWVVVLLRKLGILEVLQVRGNKFISKLASCDYCLSFWLGWVVVIPAALITGECFLLAVPFFSTTISRFLCM